MRLDPAEERGAGSTVGVREHGLRSVIFDRPPDFLTTSDICDRVYILTCRHPGSVPSQLQSPTNLDR